MLSKSFSLILLMLLIVPVTTLAENDQMNTAEAWAKAVQGRDGKKQYQLMCVNLQKTNYDKLQTENWVTGVSSPYVKSFKVEKGKQDNNIKIYKIQYQMIAGGEIMGNVTDEVQVKNGCISGFKFLSPSEADPVK